MLSLTQSTCTIAVLHFLKVLIIFFLNCKHIYGTLILTTGYFSNTDTYCAECMPKILQIYERLLVFGHGKQDAAQARWSGDWSPLQNGSEFRCCCQCWRRCDCGDVDVGLPLSLGPLIDPDRPIDVRDACRCGITNLGGGWGVNCGGIILADVCRVSAGRLIGPALVTWIELERAGKLFRGGMAGGGPRLGTDACDCIRGGSCGKLVLVSSVSDGRVCIELGVLCFAVDDIVTLACGWTAATVTVGFCDGIITFCDCVFDWLCDAELCFVEIGLDVSATGRFGRDCGWLVPAGVCWCCCGNALGALKFFFCSWPAAT